MSVATETRLDAAIEGATDAPARAPAPGRLVGRRARVERDHDRAAPLLAPRPRPARRPRPTADSPTSCSRAGATTAPGRTGSRARPTSRRRSRRTSALKLAGVDPGPQARDYIRSRGGIAKTRVFTKCFLALLGQWPWQRVTPIPARADPVPAERAVLDLQLLLLGAADVRAALRLLGAAAGAPRRRSTCARSARAPARHARRRRPGPLRRARAARAERWVRERQEADGSWGGIQPPWVWSILMLAALGHGFEDETLRRAVEGWERLHGRRGRPPPARGVPVAGLGHRPRRARAARRAALGRRAPALRARRRLAAAARRSRSTGDWAVRTPGARAGRLGVRVRERPLPRRRRHRRGRARPARAAHRGRRRRRPRPRLDRRACSRANGGWGAFDVDNRGLLALQAPVLRLRRGDRPAERRRHRARARGARAGGRLRRRRCAAGSTGCCASRRRTAPGSAAGASTTSTAPAPRCRRWRPCGIEPGHRAFRRAVAWLDSVQNEDGGFGEDIRSYADRGLARPRTQHAFPNGLGATSLRRCRRGRQRGRPSRRRLALPRRSRRTATGTSPLHRHRASRSTS